MGIKALKEAFSIKHIVHRRGDSICIGSPYVSELITIKPDGGIVKAEILRPGVNEIGQLYNKLIAADKEQLLELINSPEEFKNLKPVYREAASGKIVKEFCEEYGYPNLTTVGELMYDNVHFKTRQAALDHAITETSCVLKFLFRILWDDLGKTIKTSRSIILDLFKLVRQTMFNGN
jgi:hypothetical protein